MSAGYIIVQSEVLATARGSGERYRAVQDALCISHRGFAAAATMRTFVTAFTGFRAGRALEHSIKRARLRFLGDGCAMPSLISTCARVPSPNPRSLAAECRT